MRSASDERAMDCCWHGLIDITCTGHVMKLSKLLSHVMKLSKLLGHIMQLSKQPSTHLSAKFYKVAKRKWFLRKYYLLHT